MSLYWISDDDHWHEATKAFFEKWDS